MKYLIFLIALVLLFLNFDAAASTPFNPDKSAVFNAFRANMDTAINAIINDPNSIVNVMSRIVVRALYFCLLFWGVALFIYEGFKKEHLFIVFAAFIFGFLSETYLIWTNGIFVFFEEAGLGIQETAVGVRDQWFISTYVTGMWQRIRFEGLSLFDSVEAIILLFILLLLGLILQVVIFISEMYANFGFAVAQIMGPLFLCFLVFPATRKLFDQWLALLLGFAVYSLIVRCIGVVYVLYTMSLIDVLNARETIHHVVIDPRKDMEIMYSLMVHSVIGITFMLGAGKIASHLSGGVAGSGISGAAIMAAFKLFGKKGKG